jgi:serine/threonine-protein kinase
MLTSEAATDAETVARFRREAELARSLSHPHLVAVAGSGTENSVHWMALELVAGTSLEAAIDARGRLPWTEAAAIAVQVGEALAYLGARGVLHRDVKPANILLAADGSAKLGDLGFAKAVSPATDEGELGLTAEGMSMGSPAYMAPEQVLDAKAVTHSADVYGLGATLYHAVTGATPFTGSNGYEVMERVVRDPAPAPRTLVPDLPAGLAAFLEWSLEKDLARRPPDAATFVRELRAVLADPEDARRIAALARGREGRPHLAALAIGVVLAALVAGAIWWRWR